MSPNVFPVMCGMPCLVCRMVALYAGFLAFWVCSGALAAAGGAAAGALLERGRDQREQGQDGEDCDEASEHGVLNSGSGGGLCPRPS